jgi:hypothetical protein
MSHVSCQISVSLDGFVAGPNQSLENPLGEGGERLHEWAFATDSWREQHGKPGGEHTADAEVAAEVMQGVGAFIMGRRMFGGGDGPWDEDWRGWWGEDPPFHASTSSPSSSGPASGCSTASAIPRSSPSRWSPHRRSRTSGTASCGSAVGPAVQRSPNRYVVCACGRLAKASTLAGSIRNTAAASSPSPKTPSPTSKCQTLPYFAS